MTDIDISRWVTVHTSTPPAGLPEMEYKWNDDQGDEEGWQPAPIVAVMVQEHRSSMEIRTNDSGREVTRTNHEAPYETRTALGILTDTGRVEEYHPEDGHFEVRVKP